MWKSAGQGVPEQIAQRTNEGVGLLRSLLLGGVEDHVQGVEQKVGVDLAAKLLKLFLLQIGRAHV